MVQTVDKTGEVQNHYDYDIWGNPTLTVELVECAIRYAGEFYDSETGLYYLKSRYYNSAIARFISEDSYTGEIEDPLSLNLYTYCENDPISYTDPNGHWIVDALFLAADIVDFVKSPSLAKAAWIAVDIVSFADPTGAASTAAHATKAVKYTTKTVKIVEGTVKVTKAADKVKDTVKVLDKVKDTVKVADKVKDTVKTADKVKDTVKTADKVKDTVKASGTAKKTTKATSEVAKVEKKASSATKVAEKTTKVTKTTDKAKDTAQVATKTQKTTKTTSEVAKVEKKASTATKEVSKSGPYSQLQDSKSVGTGKNFTKTQKENIISENMKKNGGVVKSDASGQVLTKPQKSKSGVKPNQNEWQIDHITSKKKGGSNSYSNAQVLSRKENRDKWYR